MQADIVAEGLRIPEGPVAMADGSVLVVEIQGERLVRIGADGRIDVVAELPGGPNGAAFGPDGRLYVCNNGGSFSFRLQDGLNLPVPGPARHRTGSLQRIDIATGAVETLYEQAGGRRLEAPNDLVFDRNGGIWFTDYGSAIPHGRIHGSICYARPDGSHITRVKEGMISPNGIGLSPDERTLYVSDSALGRIWTFAIEAPGRLAPPPPHGAGTVLATLPGANRVDSLAVQEDGEVCVATIGEGGIGIVGQDGRYAHVPLPDPFVTNICFGGADMRTAWITAAGTGRLYRMAWPRAGHRLNFSP